MNIRYFYNSIESVVLKKEIPNKTGYLSFRIFVSMKIKFRFSTLIALLVYY